MQRFSKIRDSWEPKIHGQGSFNKGWSWVILHRNDLLGSKESLGTPESRRAYRIGLFLQGLDRGGQLHRADR